MAMHLEKPWLNTMGRSKKKPNKKQQKALAEHEIWLAKRGLKPVRGKKRSVGFSEADRVAYAPPQPVRRPMVSASDTIPENGLATGIIANLHREPVRVQREIKRKAQRVEAIYSKGPLQYVTPGTDITTIGSKSRRG